MAAGHCRRTLGTVAAAAAVAVDLAEGWMDSQAAPMAADAEGPEIKMVQY